MKKKQKKNSKRTANEHKKQNDVLPRNTVKGIGNGDFLSLSNTRAA